jgi:hypothetical protein
VEILIFILLLWFFISRSQKKRIKKTNRLVAKSISEERARYLDYMNTLPTLKGDGGYLQKVSGALTYREALDKVGLWLKNERAGQSEIWVILETEPDNIKNPNAVRIETGEETVGYIPREEAPDFGQELEQFNGRARCRARFYWDEFGSKSSLTLDVIRPLTRGASIL